MKSPLIKLWDKVKNQYHNQTALSDSNSSLTYFELHEKAVKIASYLQKAHISRQCVVISIENRVDSIVALMGVLLSGNHYFYVAPDILKTYQNQIDAASGVLILTDESTAINDYGSVKQAALSTILSSVGSDYQQVDINGGDPFVIFPTSGSTGHPKLVRHCHQYILDDTLGQIVTSAITANDVRDYAGSLMFSASLGAIFPILLSGAHLAIYPMEELGPLALSKFWIKKRVTLTTVPVSVLRVLAKSVDNLMRLESMRTIIVSAEAASKEDFELFAQKLPAHITLMNGYATTETRNITLDKHILNNLDINSFGTVGKSWNEREILILDEKGNELSQGHTGEIVVEAAFLPEGYLNNEEESAKSFTKLSNGIVQFRTGDMGYFTPDQRLVLTGRKDSIVKINGVKVNLGRAEAFLNSINEIKESAVILNGNQRIQAFLVGDGKINTEKLRKKAASALSPELIPSVWTVLDKLPKTPTGKTNRPALRRMADSAPKTGLGNAPFAQNSSVRDVIERIWKQELHISFEIQADDDFFEDLGGDSLLCAVCCDEIEKALNIQLPLGAGYTYTTLKTFQQFIEKSRENSVQRIRLNEHEEGRPTLYFIPPYPGDRRMYSGLENGLSSTYNLYFLYYNPVLPNGDILPFDTLLTKLTRLIEPAEDLNLIGYSFAGMLSYFVAMRLEQQKTVVSKLILLDTPTYQQFGRLERFTNFSERILRRVKQFVVAPKEIWSKYIVNFKESYQAYNENFTSQKGGDNPLDPTRIIWGYVQDFPKFEKLDCDIVLFRASELTTAYQFKWDFGWQRYTRGKVRQIFLHGYHEFVVKDETNQQIIIDELKKISAATFGTKYIKRKNELNEVLNLR